MGATLYFIPNTLYRSLPIINYSPNLRKRILITQGVFQNSELTVSVFVNGF